jgi:hypothetical protein
MRIRNTGTITPFFKNKKVKKNIRNSRNKDFFYFFCLMMEGFYGHKACGIGICTLIMYLLVAEEITSEQAETNNDDQLTEEGEEEEEGELERREVEQQQEEGGVSQVQTFLCT